GTLLEVIGFRSTRALTASAPEGAVQTTVLLLIDSAEGRLHEIREVIGPQGGEQVTRTIWRRLQVETVEDNIERDRAFNLAFAWNGIGDFTDVQQGLIRPELPLADASLVVAPRDALAVASIQDILAPSAPPPQSQSATLLGLNRQANARWTVLYTGGTRRLAIQSAPDTPENEALFSTENGVETATIAGRNALVRAVPGGYEVLLRGAGPAEQRTLALVVARGYSHDEVLQTLDTVRPLTLSLLESQARLFAASSLAPDARDALVGALQPQALVEQGEVQQSTARVFERHLSDVDPLGDPFHRPAYNGIPASALAVDWHYPARQETTAVYGEVQSDDGRTFASYYDDTRRQWLHLDTIGMNVERLSALELPGNKGRAALLSVLMCGNAKVVSQSGAMLLIESTEASWTVRSCVRPELPRLLAQQQGIQRGGNRRPSGEGPFVADLGQQPLTLALWIENTALRKVQLWGGAQNNGTLIESWEWLDLRSLPAGELPTLESRSAMPNGFVDEPFGAATPFSTILLRSVEITETVTLLGVPLFDPDAVTMPHHFMILTSSSTPAVQVTVNVQSPQSSALDEALWRGIVVQSLVPVDVGRGIVTNVMLYQGATNTFGAFLRAHAEWKASAPVSFSVAGRQVSGWSVVPGDDQREAYLLADVDGTLLAIRTPQSQAEWQAIDALRRVEACASAP
ncbi:MAG TPA: hypothetical protein VFT99_06120, partial [Roseiflexaceae bacterium]|nr:hypothetical protein [Roseiflexaceae bacterium]